VLHFIGIVTVWG